MNRLKPPGRPAAAECRYVALVHPLTDDVYGVKGPLPPDDERALRGQLKLAWKKVGKPAGKLYLVPVAIAGNQVPPDALSQFDELLADAPPGTWPPPILLVREDED